MTSKASIKRGFHY